MHKRTPSKERIKKNIKQFTIFNSKQCIKADEIFQKQTRELSEYFLKNALKKQSDRRTKLRKLLETYINIQQQEKKHSRLVKCSIIELKDSPILSKPRLQIDSSLMVVNTLKVEFRQFLATLLNTFYKIYKGNSQVITTINDITYLLSYKIKQLSFKEDQIFYLHNCHLQNLAVQQQSLHSLNFELRKVTSQEQKIEAEYNQVSEIFNKLEKQHIQQENTIQKLEKYLDKLQQQEKSVTKKLADQEKLRKQLWGDFLQEKMYEETITQAINTVDVDIQKYGRETKNKFQQLLHHRLVPKQNKQKHLVQNRKQKQNRNIDNIKKSRVLGALIELNQTSQTQPEFTGKKPTIGEHKKMQILFNTQKQFAIQKFLK